MLKSILGMRAINFAPTTSLRCNVGPVRDKGQRRVRVIDILRRGRFGAQGRSFSVSVAVMSAHFDLHSGDDEIRALRQSYRLAGAKCDADPVGLTQTHRIPGTSGKSPRSRPAMVTITAGIPTSHMLIRHLFLLGAFPGRCANTQAINHPF